MWKLAKKILKIYKSIYPCLYKKDYYIKMAIQEALDEGMKRNQTERTGDINLLIKGVFETDADYLPDPERADTYGCPFCGHETKGNIWDHASMAEIPHDLDCIWLIAKDLIT